VSRWHGAQELYTELGPLADSFMEFVAAQDAHWKDEGSNFEPLDKWLEDRWGSIFFTGGGRALEIVVYEQTGQYCGSFRYDPDTGSWQDLESGFTYTV
jgi:hypothetical protein